MPYETGAISQFGWDVDGGGAAVLLSNSNSSGETSTLDVSFVEQAADSGLSVPIPFYGGHPKSSMLAEMVVSLNSLPLERIAVDMTHKEIACTKESRGFVVVDLVERMIWPTTRTASLR